MRKIMCAKTSILWQYYSEIRPFEIVTVLIVLVILSLYVENKDYKSLAVGLIWTLSLITNVCQSQWEWMTV